MEFCYVHPDWSSVHEPFSYFLAVCHLSLSLGDCTADSLSTLSGSIKPLQILLKGFFERAIRNLDDM
jgi:hypothetical protein